MRAENYNHKVWELKEVVHGRSGQVIGYYLEGVSAEPTPIESEYRAHGEDVYGWFQLELDDLAQVRQELTTLGFDAEAVIARMPIS